MNQNTQQQQPLPPEAQTLLNQLHDISTPETIGFWPLAWGWWVVIIVLLLTLASVIFFVINHIKKNRYRREALILIEQLQNKTLDNESFCFELIALTKSVAKHSYPNNHTLVLTKIKGKAWLDFLEKTCKKCHFESKIKEAFEVALYSGEGLSGEGINRDRESINGKSINNENLDRDGLIKPIILWLKHHKKSIKSLSELELTRKPTKEKTKETRELHYV